MLFDHFCKIRIKELLTSNSLISISEKKRMAVWVHALGRVDKMANIKKKIGKHRWKKRLIH